MLKTFTNFRTFQRGARYAHTAHQSKRLPIGKLLLGGAALGGVIAFNSVIPIRDTFNALTKSSPLPPRTHRELRNALYWKAKNADSDVVTSFFDNALEAAEEEKMDLSKDENAIAYCAMRIQFADYFTSIGKHRESLRQCTRAIHIITNGIILDEQFAANLSNLSFPRFETAIYTAIRIADSYDALKEVDSALKTFGYCLAAYDKRDRMDEVNGPKYRQLYICLLDALGTFLEKHKLFAGESLNVHTRLLGALPKLNDSECRYGVVASRIADIHVSRNELEAAFKRSGTSDQVIN